MNSRADETSFKMVYPEQPLQTHNRYLGVIKSHLESYKPATCTVCVSHGDSMNALHEYWKGTIEKDSQRYLLLTVAYANVTMFGRKNGQWSILGPFADASHSPDLEEYMFMPDF